LKRLDLKNQRFGNLTVIESSDYKSKRGDYYWLCKCDCGKEKLILGRSLVTGKSKSCGCLKNRRSIKIVNLKGKHFGSWHVLEESGRTPNQQVKWLCQCGCGLKKSVDGRSLISGKSKGCRDCSPIRFGEKAPGWKGGLTRVQKLIRDHLSKATNWTQEVFARDDYCCQRCIKRGGRLQAHHIVKLSAIIIQYGIKSLEDVDKCGLLFDLSNGVCLCKGCHNWVHSLKNKDKELLSDTMGVEIPIKG